MILSVPVFSVGYLLDRSETFCPDLGPAVALGIEKIGAEPMANNENLPTPDLWHHQVEQIFKQGCSATSLHYACSYSEMAGPVYTDLSTAIPDVVLPGELDDPHRKATSPLQTNTAIVTVTSLTNRSAPRFPEAVPGQWRCPAHRGPSGRRSPVVRSARYH